MQKQKKTQAQQIDEKHSEVFNCFQHNSESPSKCLKVSTEVLNTWSVHGDIHEVVHGNTNRKKVKMKK